MIEAPALVTLHVWGVHRRQVPWAMSRMAVQRRPLRGVPGLKFARLLGTGHGRRFTPTDADLRHWALIACWTNADDAARFEQGSLLAAWRNHAFETCRLHLRPLASRGRWSGQEPFGRDDPDSPGLAPSPSAPCAVLTRARLVARRIPDFVRHVPPVAAALPQAPGLRFARGIGEAPIGLQATFSIWDDLGSATAFAYGSAAHRQVMARTVETGWYAEQLFARFAVLDATGVVDGRDPLSMGSGVGRA